MIIDRSTFVNNQGDFMRDRITCICYLNFLTEIQYSYLNFLTEIHYNNGFFKGCVIKSIGASLINWKSGRTIYQTIRQT